MRRAVAAALFLFTSCALFEPELPTPPDPAVEVAGDFVTIRAVGKSDPSIDNDTQRKALSREAALTLAQARLQAYADQIRVPGRGTVGSLAAQDPAWAQRRQAILTQAEAAATVWNADGSRASVALRIPRNLLLSLRQTGDSGN
jgi:hypothetical protein